MRIMAIDFGDARIGLAVSDLLGMLCGEAWTMEEWNMERASKRIAEEAKKREVERLVLGLPKNMDGSEGPRAAKSREFAELLKQDSGLPVILWDERRSSIEAQSSASVPPAPALMSIMALILSSSERSILRSSKASISSIVRAYCSSISTSVESSAATNSGISCNSSTALHTAS